MQALKVSYDEGYNGRGREGVFLWDAATRGLYGPEEDILLQRQLYSVLSVIN